MKNYLVTDLSSLCGLRAPSKSNGGKEPRWGEEGCTSLSAVFGCFGELYPVGLHGSP